MGPTFPPAAYHGCMTSVPDRSRVRLPGISSRAYEHPADRSALVALRKLTGFDVILRNLAGLFNDRALRLMFLASSVRASEDQFPQLYHDGPAGLDGRGRDALRHRPRAGARAVRPLGLPDDALPPDQPGRPAVLHPVRVDRVQGGHLGPGGVVPQVRAVLRPGRPAGGPGRAGGPPGTDEAG